MWTGLLITGAHPWVAFGIMPVFALANAGVTIGGVDLSAGPANLVTLGVAIALVLGKPIGIVAITWLTVRAGWCRLPSGVSWAGVWLVGWSFGRHRIHHVDLRCPACFPRPGLPRGGEAGCVSWFRRLRPRHS